MTCQVSSDGQSGEGWVKFKSLEGKVRRRSGKDLARSSDSWPSHLWTSPIANNCLHCPAKLLQANSWMPPCHTEAYTQIDVHYLRDDCFNAGVGSNFGKLENVDIVWCP